MTDKSAREQYKTQVKEDFPIDLVLPEFKKELSLRYGQNPGGPAAFFREVGVSGPNMANFEILQKGKGLGFINMGDMDLGQRVVKTLHDIHGGKGLVVCAVIKHEMPAGVAIGPDSLQAFVNAYNCDSLSSFGGVHVFSGEVDVGTAVLLVEKQRNAEVVYAPSFSSDALKKLAERESLRVVKMADVNLPSVDNGIDYKRVAGGMLVEYRNRIRTLTVEDVEVVSEARPSTSLLEAALFNWIVCAYTRSNAVVIGRPHVTHGIGSGQRSRIDAAFDAIRFANGRDGTSEGYGSLGTFMASDAFMPATDVVELAAKNRVKGIIYPLGSIKDQEVIDTANKYGMVMLATRKPGTQDCERVFLHR